ncbi:MAG: tyrosine-type recombinase/integrase [Acidimicrobiales bacterium]
MIGRVGLSTLRPEHVQQFLDRMTLKGFAPRTVLQARAVLGSAVARGLMSVNPVRSVTPPRVERARVPRLQRRPLAPPHRRAALRGRHPWVLAAATGMRRTEVLGLRWADVDLKHGRVRGTPTLHVAGATWQDIDLICERGDGRPDGS